MNFNLYLDDQTAKELDRTAKQVGETRSGLIRKGAARMVGQEDTRASWLAFIDP
jgi:hypothetical protein